MTIKSLRVMIEQMLETVTDKAALRAIDKFNNRVIELDSKPEEELSADAMAKLQEESERHRQAHEAEKESRLEEPAGQQLLLSYHSLFIQRPPVARSDRRQPQLTMKTRKK